VGKLSTHVLDTARGLPADGMRLELFRIQDAQYRSIGAFVTNAQGRTDLPLLEGAALEPGDYQIEFHIAPYFRALGMTTPDPTTTCRFCVRRGVIRPTGEAERGRLLGRLGQSSVAMGAHYCWHCMDRRVFLFHLARQPSGGGRASARPG
jgi:5-hydroxyisourate hydrolase